MGLQNLLKRLLCFRNRGLDRALRGDERLKGYIVVVSKDELVHFNIKVQISVEMLNLGHQIIEVL